MALMKFREPNQVKWAGSRPGHNGTQVIKSENGTGVPILMYTVPAGLTFYLTSWVFSVSDSVGGALGYFHVQDLVPATQYYIGYITTQGVGFLGQEGSFWPPLEIPTGWRLRVGSNAGTCTASALIHGWVE